MAGVGAQFLLFLAQSFGEFDQFGLDYLFLEEGLLYLFFEVFLFFRVTKRGWTLPEESAKLSSFVEVLKELTKGLLVEALFFLQRGEERELFFLFV